MSIQIVKTDSFKRKEKKYLGKLSSPQKKEYERAIEDFVSKEESKLRKIDLHALKGDLHGFHSFTCCESSGRSDRIVFEVIVDDSEISQDLPPKEKEKILKRMRAEIRFEDIEEAHFHDVGNHDVYDRM